ncbi:helix-turn-helix domain-containing protein, partial [Membranicola marinus]
HRLHKNLIEPVTAYYEEIAYVSGAKKHQRDTLDFINSLWNFMDGMTKSELDGELIYQGAPLNRPEKLDKAVRRKKKSSRESTYEITLSLHEKDMSIEEIASLRQLTENTIYGHFIHLYKKGKVDITSLLDKEKLADLLPHFTNVSEETSLTEIKSRLPFTATYNEIRAAKAYYLEKN